MKSLLIVYHTLTGGSRDALEAFVEFRGRKPQVAALLKQYGIAA